MKDESGGRRQSGRGAAAQPYRRQSSLIGRQGLPAANTPGGMLRVTTLPAPITECAPMVTPPRMMQPEVIQQ